MTKSGTEEGQGDMETEQMSSQLNESDIEAITTCVDEITKVYSLASTLIVSIVVTVPDSFHDILAKKVSY